jgi:hypothetical protein
MARGSGRNSDAALFPPALALPVNLVYRYSLAGRPAQSPVGDSPFGGSNKVPFHPGSDVIGFQGSSPGCSSRSLGPATEGRKSASSASLGIHPLVI